MTEQKIIVGKFINNLDSEDLTSEKLQGVVNNVYAKAISSHKKKEKEVEDNTKDLEKETVEFIKSNHDRLKANKEKPDKELNEKKLGRKLRRKVNEDAYDDYFGDKGVDYLIGLVKDIAKKGDLRRYNLTQSDFYEVWDGLKELKKNRSFDTVVENAANFIGENSNLLVYSKGNGWHIEVNNMYESKELKEDAKPSELWYNKKEALNNIWGLVCEGDNRLEDIKYIFEKGLLKPNEFRYNRFGAKHSLIMGALRNGNYKTAELLKSLGEKILKSEVEEYKDLMARKVYSDETTRDALDEDKIIAKFQDDDQVHEIHDYENGTFANHYDAKTPGHMISYYDSEKEARKQMRRHRPFAKEIKESKKLKEDLTDIKQEWEEMTREPIIEFDDEYYYIEPDWENGKLYAGSATNTGVFHDFEIDLDPDLNLDENIAELYDHIISERPELFGESLIKESAEKIQPGNIYSVLVKELPAEDIDHHYSDLYVRKTPKSTEIINRLTTKSLLSTFKDNIDGDIWYELPFCYVPYFGESKKLTEAKSSKKLIYTIGDRFVAHQLDGVTSPFNREFDAAKKYRDISNDPNFKHGSIGCKGKSYKTGVNQWVKTVEPTEFMVWTKKENPSWKDDVLDVYYRKETVNESKKLTRGGKRLTEAEDGNMTIETSTSILDMFYPSLYQTIDDYYIPDNEWGRVDDILANTSMEFAEEAIRQVFPRATVKFKELRHPREYNYGGENIIFDVTLPRADYESVKQKVAEDPNFAEFLKKNSPRSGYIPFGAYTVDKFKTQDDMYSIGQIVKFLADEEDMAYDFDEKFREEISSNFDTYDILWEEVMDWLREHDQAYQDFLTHFHADENSVIDLDSIIGWISEHDTLSQDFENRFGFSLGETSLKEDWTVFEFTSGSNPYIAKTDKEVKRLLKKYKDKVRKINDTHYEVDDKERFGWDKPMVDDDPLPFGPGAPLKEAKGAVGEKPYIVAYLGKEIASFDYPAEAQEYYEKKTYQDYAVEGYWWGLRSEMPSDLGWKPLPEEFESLKEDFSKIQEEQTMKLVRLLGKGLITKQEFEEKLYGILEPKLVRAPMFKNTKIKDFYTDNYPEDDLGEEINDTVTVQDVVDLLNDGRGDDFYSLIGVSDSLVRERIFAFIADACGVKYEKVYDKWLGESLTESKKLTESLDNVDIQKFVDSYKKNYELLSDGITNNEDAIEFFDRWVAKKKHDNFMKKFAEVNGDYVSSDREAVAFAFTLEDFGLIFESFKTSKKSKLKLVNKRH